MTDSKSAKRESASSDSKGPLGEKIVVRVDQATLARLDAVAAGRPRAEVVRSIIAAHFAT